MNKNFRPIIDWSEVKTIVKKKIVAIKQLKMLV